MRVKRHVTEKTKVEVYERDNGKCVLSGKTYPLERVPHHAFYGQDAITDETRNSKYQLVTIAMDEHRPIHNYGDRKRRDRCIQYLFDLYGEKFYRDRGFKRQL